MAKHHNNISDMSSIIPANPGFDLLIVTEYMATTQSILAWNINIERLPDGGTIRSTIPIVASWDFAVDEGQTAIIAPNGLITYYGPDDAYMTWNDIRLAVADLLKWRFQ